MALPAGKRISESKLYRAQSCIYLGDNSRAQITLLSIVRPPRTIRRKERAAFSTQSSQFHKYRIHPTHLSLRAFAFIGIESSHVRLRTRAIARIGVRVGVGTSPRDETGQRGRGGQRASRGGEARGCSLRGWGFSFGSLFPPPSLRSLLCLSASPPRPHPLPSPRCRYRPSACGVAEPVECGARDGRGSILRRVEGVLGRAWHAHTPGRGGFKERDTLHQFIPVIVSVGIPLLR